MPQGRDQAARHRAVTAQASGQATKVSKRVTIQIGAQSARVLKKSSGRLLKSSMTAAAFA